MTACPQGALQSNREVKQKDTLNMTWLGGGGGRQSQRARERLRDRDREIEREIRSLRKSEPRERLLK